MDWFAAREEEKFYTITSLYFDTEAYQTYWDKEQEVPVRFKLRVRTYGNECDGPVKVEVKRRFNEVSLKSRAEVPPETWPLLLRAPVNGSASKLDDFILLTQTLGARPKMLVRYQRQAFTSRIDRYVRITFDRRLLYQPTGAYDLKGGANNWRSNDGPRSLDEPGSWVILELKFMTRAPVWLVDLVRRFGLIRRGFSKYCSAVSYAVYAEPAVTRRRWQTC
jgi:SPX domain protein involved in polyphosphate accumulation